MEVVHIYERLAVRSGSGAERGEILVREPIRAAGCGAQLSLPVVDTLKSVVHWPENHHIWKLVLQRLRDGNGLGDISVRRHRVRALHFQMRGVPQLRLVVQTDESGMRGIRAKNSHAGEFLIKRPYKFV